MNETRPSVRAAASTPDLEDAVATPFQRYCALALCAFLICASGTAAAIGLSPGPEIKALVPITATVWSLAELLTAFLLLAQFYINGGLAFGFLTCAYGFSGILTWPYVAAFPGIFRAAPSTLGEQQISISLWVTWHCVFPALVILAALNDSSLQRILAHRAIRIASIAAVVVPILAAAGVSWLVLRFCDALPHLVIDGDFQPLYRHVCIPVIVLLNAIACGTLLLRRRRLTSLSLWLAVASFSAALDALLNLSASRYTFAWDMGKLITVFTASVVLLMILGDIFGLYGRLARVARIDMLTSLHNRRAFDEHYRLVFHNARRLRSSMGLLVIDIDLFKAFNDAYGHAAGDECLRRVATAMERSATRPLDLVARYGGEEFVVVLPDTPLHGVLHLAERLREVVSELEIVHGGKSLGPVTISIGIGYVPDAKAVTESELFNAADRALYDAKDRGRNRIMLGSTELARMPDPLLERTSA